MPGQRETANTLDRITSDVEASQFVIQLWCATRQLYGYEHIFDSDIQEKIKDTLSVICEVFDHKSPLLIKDEHMPGVVSIAREMIEMNFKCQNNPNEECVLGHWLPKMDQAVGLARSSLLVTRLRYRSYLIMSMEEAEHTMKLRRRTLRPRQETGTSTATIV
jgi:hypothetical protein